MGDNHEVEVTGERRKDLRRREHFERLRLNLQRRLWPLCHSMPDLDRLTAKMTRLRLKYESTTALPDWRSLSD